MSYQTTREECAKKIEGICPRCGGEVVPLETVDNGGRPTFWSGCESCMVYTYAVPKRIRDMAVHLVHDFGHRPYGKDEVLANIGQACGVVRYVERMLAEEAAAESTEREG
jgi:hypothetical protein